MTVNSNFDENCIGFFSCPTTPIKSKASAKTKENQIDEFAVNDFSQRLPPKAPKKAMKKLLLPNSEASDSHHEVNDHSYLFTFHPRKLFIVETSHEGCEHRVVNELCDLFNDLNLVMKLTRSYVNNLATLPGVLKFEHIDKINPRPQEKRIGKWVENIELASQALFEAEVESKTGFKFNKKKYILLTAGLNSSKEAIFSQIMGAVNFLAVRVLDKETYMLLFKFEDLIAVEKFGAFNTAKDPKVKAAQAQAFSQVMDIVEENVYKLDIQLESWMCYDYHEPSCQAFINWQNEKLLAESSSVIQNQTN